MLKRPLVFLLLLFIATSCSTGKYSHRPTPHGKFRRPVVVIDAGHGGKDDGTKSLTKPPIVEKHFNIQTALILEEILQGYGIQTILTRGDDTFIPLKVRAAIANGNCADLFVSIHYNAAENKKAHGVEVYYYDSEDHRALQSKELAHSVLAHFLQKTKSNSRGVKHGNYAVIRETEMPAILVESGFLTNEEELQRIMTPGFIESVACGVAQGIYEYLKK